MPMQKQPLTFELGILGFMRQEPLHGYEIYQRMQASEGMGLAWGLKQNQLYAELIRLEEEGYLSSSIEEQGTRPPRKIFQLTAYGVQHYTEWVNSPVMHGRNFQREFPIKLYFAQQAGREVAQRLIATQQATCGDWLAALPASAEPDLIHEFRQSQIETMLAWLETCADSI
ncbi:PadR family transcriptional regulator [Candidatus Oscillochloris fontis]|uniref:PadR family transcriptional regulator n=1 Tax=Candidatus Oscillochloris fontis TaxID=2496868 RepID=UPI00101D87EA|nr:PadR family transcriptional regulator [Candidatus Oscillochloris fontis]